MPTSSAQTCKQVAPTVRIRVERCEGNRGTGTSKESEQESPCTAHGSFCIKSSAHKPQQFEQFGKL